MYSSAARMVEDEEEEEEKENKRQVGPFTLLGIVEDSMVVKMSVQHCKCVLRPSNIVKSG